MTSITGTVSFECVSAWPKYTSLSRQVQRKRTDMKIPQSIRDIAIPMELQQTLRGQNFLAYDSGSDNPDRFLLFRTEKNLDTLEVNTVCHADGTFKSCPSLFYQVYTVHAVMNGHSIPLFYFLLHRKTEDLYVKALSQQKTPQK